MQEELEGSQMLHEHTAATVSKLVRELSSMLEAINKIRCIEVAAIHSRRDRHRLRYHKSAVSAHFDLWHNVVLDEISKRRRTAQLVRKWREMELLQRMRAWHEGAKAQRHLFARTRRLVFVWMRKTCISALVKWKCAVEEEQVRERGERRRMQQQRSICLRQRLRDLRQIMGAWLKWVYEQQALKRAALEEQAHAGAKAEEEREERERELEAEVSRRIDAWERERARAAERERALLHQRDRYGWQQLIVCEWSCACTYISSTGIVSIARERVFMR